MFRALPLSYSPVKVELAGLEPATTHLIDVIPLAFVTKFGATDRGVAETFHALASAADFEASDVM